jgi:nucleotide-binding universal stress UspA family protein
MPFQHIYVPVDGSATSTRGLKAAIELAKALGARLSIMHVVESTPLMATAEGAAYLPQLIDDLRKAGVEITSAAKARADKAGVPCEAEVVEQAGGPIYETIVRDAKRRKADVIVLGTHGRRGVARLLMGSDAAGVVREATVPVMLVRGGED